MNSIARNLTVVMAPLLLSPGVLAQTAPAAPLSAEEMARRNAADAAEARDKATAKANDESAFEFSYAAPGSPVLPLLGVTGDQITRSESLRKFGVAVLNGFGGKGSDQALAIDFSPYWVLSPRTMSLKEYREGNAMGRLAARTKVGLAVSFGEKTAGRPSSFVTSISTSLLDSHDSLFNSTFTDCIRAALNPTLRQIASGEDEDTNESGVVSFRAELAKFEKGQPGLIEKEYAACATKLTKALASAPSLDVGAGVRYTGAPGRLEQLDRSGTILWGTFATGVIGGRDEDAPRAGPLAKLRVRGLLHARYTFKEDVLDDKFVFQGRRDMGMIVAGIESAPSLDPKQTETLRWNLQAGWNRQSAVLPTDVDKRFWRYQAIASLRIMDGLWANGTLGRVSGKGVKTDTKALLTLTFTEPGKPSQLNEFYNSRDK